MSLCELLGIQSCAVFGIMVSFQSSAIATSHRFRMGRKALARAQPIKMREFSKLVTRLLFREYVSREVFEKRKFFILWICLRVRMDSRNRSFSRNGIIL